MFFLCSREKAARASHYVCALCMCLGAQTSIIIHIPLTASNSFLKNYFFHSWVARQKILFDAKPPSSVTSTNQQQTARSKKYEKWTRVKWMREDDAEDEGILFLKNLWRNVTARCGPGSFSAVFAWKWFILFLF